jgi:hypothetical protein
MQIGRPIPPTEGLFQLSFMQGEHPTFEMECCREITFFRFDKIVLSCHLNFVPPILTKVT